MYAETKPRLTRLQAGAPAYCRSPSDGDASAALRVARTRRPRHPGRRRRPPRWLATGRRCRSRQGRRPRRPAPRGRGCRDRGRRRTCGDRGFGTGSRDASSAASTTGTGSHTPPFPAPDAAVWRTRDGSWWRSTRGRPRAREIRSRWNAGDPARSPAASQPGGGSTTTRPNGLAVGECHTPSSV